MLTVLGTTLGKLLWLVERGQWQAWRGVMSALAVLAVSGRRGEPMFIDWSR